MNLLPAKGIMLLLVALLVTGCSSYEPDLCSVSPGGSYRHGSGGDMLPPGNWWKEFDDTALNELMCRFDESNPSLDAALARREQVRASLGIEAAGFYPTVVGDLSAKRHRDSQNGLFVPESPLYSQFEAALNLQYEIDLWGRVRKSVAAARSDYLASEGDFAAAILSLKASLARNYYQFRYIEEEIDVVRETVDLRQQNRDLIKVRVDAGDTTDLDLARADAELETARAQQLELERSREEFYHAIAALVGTTPAEFTMPKRDPRISVPEFPPGGFPCELLSRRPDVYAARERVCAATARIGVTAAEFLPRFTIAGTGGVSSLKLSTLLDPDSLFGNIGPEIRIPVFQAGRSKSEIARAEEVAKESLALYREAVLNAVRDTETSVSDASWLDRQIVALRRSDAASAKAGRLSRARYEDGLVSYLEVIDADRVALNARRELIRTRTARQLAAIRAVQALGGGWAVCLDSEPQVVATPVE
ncbi:MAG: efflux transporter outer membrane subunit [Verrucomicrobiales bacterium]|nr:efflux transporter outer membrane subunit [Verrucomicrobiales bacterium]